MAKPRAQVSAENETSSPPCPFCSLGSGVSLGRGWHRVEQGSGCQRRACQENVISLHKTCSSPAPLLQQQLKSFLLRLSQYCHIAASVEVLGGPVEGAPWVF